jgi:hypothetical protein
MLKVTSFFKTDIYKPIVLAKIIVFALYLINPFHVSSQISTKDSIVSGFILDVNYSFHIPKKDLEERFGYSSTTGVSALYKTKKNLLYGLNFNYEFGGDVKIEDEIFKQISTTDGYIIDGDGLYAEVFTYERAWYAMGIIGKIFPIIGPNENCGPFFTLGGGYLQHKIKITNTENTAPQIKDEYKKGYDRLTGGYCLYQQLGYFNIGNKKGYSFSLSFEIIEAFTKPLRNYQFDLMAPEPNKTRTDILWGMRFSWMIPLIKQASDGYFID